MLSHIVRSLLSFLRIISPFISSNDSTLIARYLAIVWWSMPIPADRQLILYTTDLAGHLQYISQLWKVFYPIFSPWATRCFSNDSLFYPYICRISVFHVTKKTFFETLLQYLAKKVVHNNHSLLTREISLDTFGSRAFVSTWLIGSFPDLWTEKKEQMNLENLNTS